MLLVKNKIAEHTRYFKKVAAKDIQRLEHCDSNVYINFCFQRFIIALAETQVIGE